MISCTSVDFSFFFFSVISLNSVLWLSELDMGLSVHRGHQFLTLEPFCLLSTEGVFLSAFSVECLASQSFQTRLFNQPPQLLCLSSAHIGIKWIYTRLANIGIIAPFKQISTKPMILIILNISIFIT